MAVISLAAPVSGWAAPLEEVPDPAFAERMLGDGLAIDPVSPDLVAPCDGTVLSVHRARHAVTLRTRTGADILLHVGVDTVALGGEGFVSHVQDGQDVRAGDRLLSFDLDLLARKARSLMTMMIVVSEDGFSLGDRVTDREVQAGDPVLSLSGGTDPASPEISEISEISENSETLGLAPLPDCMPDAGRAETTVRLPLAQGLHARPAAALAALAKAQPADITLVAPSGRTANARSMVALMALGAGVHDSLTVQVCNARTAAEAASVAERVAGAIAEGLGDPVCPAPGGPAASGGTSPEPSSGSLPLFTAGEEVQVTGAIASPGLVTGVAHRLVRAAVAVPEHGTAPAQEQAALDAALRMVAADLLAASAAATDETRKGIFAAHRGLLDDPELMASAAVALEAGRSAGAAWRQACQAQCAVLATSSSPRLRERADDLRDVERRVLTALYGGAQPAPSLPEQAVLVAEDLYPSDLADLADPANPNRGRVVGFVTALGGPTSHVAILAATMGLPAVVATGDGARRIPDGAPLIVDGNRGMVRVFASQATLTATRQAIAERAARHQTVLASAADPAVTTDGTTITVYANLGRPQDGAAAVRNGADGCGLLRSEFLFLDRLSSPDQREQTDAYQAIADGLAGRPVVIRTLDVGGDKPLPYLPLPPEDNPALGLRGVRVSLRQPDLLRTQIRAILAVQPVGQCQIMVPMIATVDELKAVRALVAEEAAAAGVTTPVAVGTMIEVPAAALLSRHLAEHADFFSIGTNDLTQYALAMDRGNPHLAPHLDSFHPGVLALIAATCDGAAALGRPVSVCGGVASDLRAAPLLIGLGVTRLSAAPGVIPELKAFVRTLSRSRCQELAGQALTLPDGQAVRALIEAEWPGL